MKEFYKTPLFTVEELTKADVLCTSGIDPTKFDNVVSSGEGNGENDLGGMSNIL